MIPTHFFDLIQEACLPGVWSKGVGLARSEAVIEDSISADEMVFRVRGSDQPISRKVTLWPNDDDWFCDCNDRNEVCAHVAAVVIALKSGKAMLKADASRVSHTSQVIYRFTRKEGKLHFNRWIAQPGQPEEFLADTLVSYAGGIASGRINSLSLAATKEDFAVDHALGDKKRGELDRLTLIRLFKILSDCSNFYLDDQPIALSPKPIFPIAKLVDDPNGFRLKIIQDPSVTEVFSNGAVLCGNILRGLDIPSLSASEKECLSPDGKQFSFRDTPFLVSDFIPSLEKKLPVEIQSQNLPKIKQVAPEIIIQTEKEHGSDTLIVLPILDYPKSSEDPDNQAIIIPDPIAEKSLIRSLQSELQLTPGQTVRFENDAAVEFTLRLKKWKTKGDGVSAFSLYDPLQSSLKFQNDQFEVSFATKDSNAKADPDRVLKAWKNNENYVPLLSGGWAPLPKDWLFRYWDRISSFIAAKNSDNKIPNYLVPALTDLCDELNQPYPDTFKHLREFLQSIDKIQPAKLPEDLTAHLRPYQQIGVNWLCFLRDANLGALLADDMGLGKTLQALCAVQGRTLIVTPTSVLKTWASQIELFRPKTSFNIYYGNQRLVDKLSQITLTTYALLRLDKDILTRENWDTVVLDEAQTIKNPDSQVAKAAHQLHAQFKMALSGTPVENRLDDLWSQFQFLNPGLLGTKDLFHEQFVSPISRGSSEASQLLRSRIRPFILRRLKKEVAPELPPRTETVLYCELNEEEREVYDSILASTRKEVLEKLETGQSIFAALELLLRLRQACCHTSLVPGQTSNYSSKLDLLVQTLENSLASGHRGLIFSQWTSYLDLIEPVLEKNGISYSRLDGTTKNRQEIVEQFQNQSGPSVMLISLKAGGVGITLTAADHIFLMDPWWNPAAEDQAADRSHRIGQKNPVLIHRLVAQGTIEDKILNLQKNKIQLAASILQDASQAASITREDLLLLLS